MSVAVLREDGLSCREQLSRRLRGDLDDIVATALRKEPGRRYASAEELAGDLRRHLLGEPVLAPPGSFGSRMRRWGVRLVAGKISPRVILSGSGMHIRGQGRVGPGRRGPARRDSRVSPAWETFRGPAGAGQPSETLAGTRRRSEAIPDRSSPGLCLLHRGGPTS